MLIFLANIKCICILYASWNLGRYGYWQVYTSLAADTDWFILHRKYHGCWWCYDASSKWTNSHGIDLIIREYSVSVPNSRLSHDVMAIHCHPLWEIRAIYLRTGMPSRYFVFKFWICVTLFQGRIAPKVWSHEIGSLNHEIALTIDMCLSSGTSETPG